MLQRIFCVLVCLFRIGWSDIVEYGGISLWCENECGLVYDDQRAPNIADQFCESISDAFLVDCRLYDKKGRWRKFEPYRCSWAMGWSSIDITRYNLEKAGGVLVENADKKDAAFDHPYFIQERYEFSHAGLIKAYEQVQADLLFYRDQRIKFLKSRLAFHKEMLSLCEDYVTQGYTHFDFDEETGKATSPFNMKLLPKAEQSQGYILIFSEISSHKKMIQAIINALNDIPLQKSIDRFAQTFREIDELLKEWFIYCLKHHQLEGISFDNAIESFLVGDYFSAIEYIRTLIGLLEKYQFSAESLSKIHFLKGQLQAEVSCHGDAILSLTDAIAKNPALKEAYFERAVSYFEIGDFAKALDDYFMSGSKKSSASEWSLVSLGISVGIIKGGTVGVVEFIPSVLSSFCGLGHGLWALCSDTVGSVEEITKAALSCIQYMKDHSALDAIKEMVPELKDLMENSDILGDYEKGNLIGSAIGRYGIEIFLSGGTTKAIKCYRELKRANQLATLEAFTSPKNTQKILEEAGRRLAVRKETLKNATLKIHKGKQEKHIKGKKNFESGKSIFQHDDPERLIREYAGTGIKDPLHAKATPGTAGYKEIVNFEEKIGLAVNEFTGVETPTSWGKIHYAKDGVHIVPTFPPKH